MAQDIPALPRAKLLSAISATGRPRSETEVIALRGRLRLAWELVEVATRRANEALQEYRMSVPDVSALDSEPLARAEEAIDRLARDAREGLADLAVLEARP